MWSPITIAGHQFHVRNTVFGLTIGTLGAIGTGVAGCIVIKQGSFTKTSGSFAVAGVDAGRTIGTARCAISVGRFTHFVQISIDATFFARRFAFAVLVLTGRAGHTNTFGAAVGTQFTRITFRTALFGFFS